MFDKKWNADFRYLPPDPPNAYTRGGRDYRRPIGALRYAIRVLGKYADGDAWLGAPGHDRTNSSEGEWPVAYHGTGEPNAQGIIEQGFLTSKSERQRYGKGIYCAPDPKTALIYSTNFNDLVRPV